MRLAKGMKSVNGLDENLFTATWDDGMDDSMAPAVLDGGGETPRRIHLEAFDSTTPWF